MIVGGYAIQFWIAVLWLVSTCINTAIKRNDQGFSKPRIIPTWLFMLTFFSTYACLIGLAVYIGWYAAPAFWILGFILAIIGVSETVGGVFLMLFPLRNDVEQD